MRTINNQANTLQISQLKYVNLLTMCPKRSPVLKSMMQTQKLGDLFQKVIAVLTLKDSQARVSFRVVVLGSAGSQSGGESWRIGGSYISFYPLPHSKPETK